MGETEIVHEAETVGAEEISCEYNDALEEREPCEVPATYRASVGCRLCRHVCGWINLCPEHVAFCETWSPKVKTRCHLCRIGRMKMLKYVRLNNG